MSRSLRSKRCSKITRTSTTWPKCRTVINLTNNAPILCSQSRSIVRITTQGTAQLSLSLRISRQEIWILSLKIGLHSYSKSRHNTKLVRTNGFKLNLISKTEPKAWPTSTLRITQCVSSKELRLLNKLRVSLLSWRKRNKPCSKNSRTPTTLRKEWLRSCTRLISAPQLRLQPPLKSDDGSSKKIQASCNWLIVMSLSRMNDL